MLLAIDIGNTNITLGLYQGDTPGPRWRLATAHVLDTPWRLFVGYLDGTPVASGAWRRRDDVEALGSTSTAEIKRMYVAPAARGRGLARAMLAHLERTALEAGASVSILETGTLQPEAIALYESSGYVEVPKFGFYCSAPESRCYGKRLSGVGTADLNQTCESADAPPEHP